MLGGGGLTVDTTDPFSVPDGEETFFRNNSVILTSAPGGCLALGESLNIPASHCFYQGRAVSYNR